MQEYIDLKVDFAKRNAKLSGTTLENVVVRSYDTAIKFRIEIADHVLDNTYDVKILSKYSASNLKVMNTLKSGLEIADGKLIYTPKVNLITEADYVRNFLYLSKDGLGLDMAQFNYEVDVSQIGEVAVEVRQVYDESYEALIAEFEQTLKDYKLTLPQADSVRAEIDVVLNQFGVDSQAKLLQYDTDAQQAIADNQMAFNLAETGRQNTYEQLETDRTEAFEQTVVGWNQVISSSQASFNTAETGRQSNYEQAEDIRNQASNQAVADWEQGADALIKIVETNESARVDAEVTRKTAETDRVSSETTRKTNETTRISNENARKSAEVIRLSNEAGRVNAENVRAEFYEGFESELGKKANKQQEAWIAPTLLNGWTNFNISNFPHASFYKSEVGKVDTQGLVTGGASSTVAFVLPTGYRPSKTLHLQAMQTNGVSTHITVFPSGSVSIFFTGTPTYVSLTGISFRAEV